MATYNLPEAQVLGRLKALSHLGRDSSDENVRDGFEEACKKVAAYYMSLRTRTFEDLKKKRFSPNQYLQERAYHIGLIILEAEKLEALRPLFPDEARRRKGLPSLKENLFYWILVYMFGRDDQHLNLAARNRMAKQLLYASWHGIPPYLLSGFLHQVGSPDEIGKKISERKYQRWHAGS